MKLFGVSFTAPSILVVISGIWCTALIVLLVHHWGCKVHVGMASFFLSRPLLTDWLPVFCVDLIGLAILLTGLYLFLKARRWYLSIPICVAAVLCKFLLISAPWPASSIPS